MSMLPYEIIDIILKMASTTSDIYYLQVDHKTGKLIYKYNMKCTRLSNLKIYPTTQFKQYLLHNNKMYNIYSRLINGHIYKKNIENTIFIYYKKNEITEKFNGELIENGLSNKIVDYNIWSSIRHTDGMCYDLVGFPVF